MNSDKGPVYLSALDEERFGIRTAKARGVTVNNLSTIMEYCLAQRVSFLIARCLVSELRAAQAMEREGFRLMDTLIYCKRDLLKKPIPQDNEQVLIRPFKTGEEEAIKLVAAETFRGYIGHYHADDRLNQEKCDEVYTSWAYRSCLSREVAEEVLVADRDGTIVGFFTLRLNSPEEGEAVVGGVLPSARKLGIYKSFMIQGMNWILSKGAVRMVVSTQITNTAVQKVWARLGFEPSHAYYTFHKWMENP